MTRHKKHKHLAYLRGQIGEKGLKRIRHLRLNLDGKVLAEMWPDFVGLEKRMKKEVPFLLKHIERTADVFDACLGSGAATIGLKLAGVYNIISNEIDQKLVRVAKTEATRFGVELKDIHNYDWRDIPPQLDNRFDSVLCLGNSLGYLFKRKDQLRALSSFRRILKEKGRLIIDERNYGLMFEKIFKHEKEIVYCGNLVEGRPILIKENLVVMEYQHKENGKVAHLVVYPFKKGEIIGLLEEVGFNEIEIYSDYRKGYDPKAEFITYVCSESR
ncbi:class I SAM-dependent methyltransferase [Candidatus Micrarchaeota archaeon]|nr:class I SAM-dependent methyltransferase [Candidatus Micrarchaeota archaeon]